MNTLSKLLLLICTFGIFSSGSELFASRGTNNSDANVAVVSWILYDENDQSNFKDAPDLIEKIFTKQDSCFEISKEIFSKYIVDIKAPLYDARNTDPGLPESFEFVLEKALKSLNHDDPKLFIVIDSHGGKKIIDRQYGEDIVQSDFIDLILQKVYAFQERNHTELHLQIFYSACHSNSLERVVTSKVPLYENNSNIPKVEIFTASDFENVAHGNVLWYTLEEVCNGNYSNGDPPVAYGLNAHEIQSFLFFDDKIPNAENSHHYWSNFRKNSSGRRTDTDEPKDLPQKVLSELFGSYSKEIMELLVKYRTYFDYQYINKLLEKNNISRAASYVMRGLNDIKDEKVLEILTLLALSSSYEDIRYEAISILGNNTLFYKQSYNAVLKVYNESNDYNVKDKAQKILTNRGVKYFAFKDIESADKEKILKAISYLRGNSYDESEADKLINLLSSSDEDIKLAVLETLSYRSKDTYSDKLLDTYNKSKSIKVKLKIMSGVSFSSSQVCNNDSLITDIMHSEEELQLYVIRQFENCGKSEKITKALFSAYNNGNLQIKLAVINALRWIGNDDIYPTIIEFLLKAEKEPNVQISIAASKILIDRSPYKGVVEKLKSKNNEVLLKAIEQLNYYAFLLDVTVEELIKIYQETSSKEIKRAIINTFDFKELSPRGLDLLISVLNGEDDEDLKIAAMMSLSYIKNPKSLDILIKVFNNSNNRLKKEAFDTICEIYDSKTVEFLFSLVVENNNGFADKAKDKLLNGFKLSSIWPQTLKVLEDYSHVKEVRKLALEIMSRSTDLYIEPYYDDILNGDPQKIEKGIANLKVYVGVNTSNNNAIIAAITDPDKSIRQRGLHALAKLSVQEIYELLVSNLNTYNKYIVSATIGILDMLYDLDYSTARKLKDILNEKTPLIVRLLNEPDREIQKYIFENRDNLDDIFFDLEHANDLVNALSKSRYYSKKTFLNYINIMYASIRLIPLLKDKSPKKRFIAITLLAGSSFGKIIYAVKNTIFNDSSREVKIAGIETISSLLSDQEDEWKKVIEILIKVIQEDKDSKVRKAAVTALYPFYNYYRIKRYKIRKALKYVMGHDSNQRVKYAAYNVLNEIIYD